MIALGLKCMIVVRKLGGMNHVPFESMCTPSP